MQSKEYVPRYLELYNSGELGRRVEESMHGLRKCRVCPWHCEVDRMNDETKVCKTGRFARVSSYFPHFGEEDCLRGWSGSGTIFFSWCNLRCVFCQNYDISQQEAGVEIGPKRLAQMMLELQRMGCHNINWVTPEHVVPQILEAMPIAIEGGLRLPIVYNTSAFDSLDSIRLMDGIVDIYMPDFKYWSPDKSKKYLKHRDYPKVAREVIKEMHRQVGDLVTDHDGLAVRGLLVRHLVMPDGLEETARIMDFLAHQISPETYVNLLAQYHPDGKVSSTKYPEINRTVTRKEMAQARNLARATGLSRLDVRKPHYRLFNFG